MNPTILPPAAPARVPIGPANLLGGPNKEPIAVPNIPAIFSPAAKPKTPLESAPATVP